MQLSDEALRLASDELNRLAKQKQDLEHYLDKVKKRIETRHFLSRTKSACACKAGQKRLQRFAKDSSVER